ncbi:MAG: N-acetylmuramoyl-L-alanine amidase [Deltaproteobacteria bacterium]|nr:N-acetylmuramoyl-L-alanine amidase [Deltaproteobacteria bacterium]
MKLKLKLPPALLAPTIPGSFIMLAGVIILTAAGCRQSDHGDFSIVAEESYLYADPSLKTRVFKTDSRSVVKVCGKSGGATKLCPISPGRSLYINSALTTGMPPLSSPWSLAHLVSRDATLDLHFRRPANVSDPSLHPVIWLDAPPDGSGVLIRISPAVDAREKTFYATPEMITKIRVWQYGEHETLVHWSPSPFYGIESRWLAPDLLRLTVKSAVRSPAIVVLDPGHGNGQPGAAVPGTAMTEAELTLRAALIMKSELEKSPIKVLLTRSRDTARATSPLTLAQRVELAEKNGADLFISLHLDNWPTSAFPGLPPKGVSIYFERWFSAPWAAKIAASLPAGNSRERWIVKRDLAVLLSYQVPSLLIELANLAFEEDRRLALDPSLFEQHVRQVAVAIGSAVQEPPQ